MLGLHVILVFRNEWEYLIISHLANSHFVNSIWSTLTKWELAKWELAKWELTPKKCQIVTKSFSSQEGGVWAQDIYILWQSRVDYSITYFDCIAVFEAPYR